MISIVTDTSVGYSAAELESRGVHLVSLGYTIGGVPYSEQARGENGDFYASLQGHVCKTGQPTPYAFSQLFESLTQNGGEVLCVVISGALSGTLSSAQRAAQPFGARVRVVDSGTTNAGQHLLIDEAVNMIVGNLPLGEICNNLEELKGKISTVFSVDSLEPLKKGGRFPGASAAATTLNIRPVFVLEKAIRFIKNVRGEKARVAALTAAVPDSARRIFVMKTEGVDTSAIEAALATRFPHTKIHQRTVGPVLSIHVGAGMGIAYIQK